VEFLEVLRGRESVRSYDPERPVPQDVLSRVLEAGRIAPSAANRQPWKFLLVSSPAALERVRTCYGQPWFRDAPHVLVVKGNREQAWKRARDGYVSIETDLTIAMDHMILAAENEGLGTCWIAAFDPHALRQALALGSDEVVFAITPVGYPRPGYSKRAAKARKPLDEVVEIL
jgi:nitroreductase